MAALVVFGSVGLLSYMWVRAARRERALLAEMATLTARVRELSVRVDAAEADVAHACTQADISESLLLEKGVADEEDIEAARRRFDGGEPGGPDDVPSREGELH